MGAVNLQQIIDTNILIYHLNNCLPEYAEKSLEKFIILGTGISVITRIELLSWQNHTPITLQLTQDLLSNFHECPLNEEVIQKCIILRRDFRIKIPDALIAATALYYTIPLITRNVDDFKAVPELKLINPYDHRSTK